MMSDQAMVFLIFLAGAVVALVGVFMWQGAWATLAAFGFIVMLAALTEFRNS
jgi:hypothetical protein